MSWARLGLSAGCEHGIFRPAVEQDAQTVAGAVLAVEPQKIMASCIKDGVRHGTIAGG
jgi:hypothetical protein